MEIGKKKKDVIWWIVLVAIILLVTFKWPMFVFGVAITIGIWKWLGFSPPKPAESEEKDDDSTPGDENGENHAEVEQKSDSS